MSHQVVSVKVYAAVFGALLALTVTTVAVSKLELGEYNFIVAMTIAVIKGTLVVMFFMDVRRASSMTKLFVGAGFFWLGDSPRLPPQRLFKPWLASQSALVVGTGLTVEGVVERRLSALNEDAAKARLGE